MGRRCRAGSEAVAPRKVRDQRPRLERRAQAVDIHCQQPKVRRSHWWPHYEPPAAPWRLRLLLLLWRLRRGAPPWLGGAPPLSYRPITLLNCDFKMVSKAVSARLQPALDAVVDELQTAFITGRWIGDNALYLQGLIEWMRLDVGADGTPRQGGALYFLDIEKAYDRVHRQWLYASAEGLGFGPRMLRWIRLLTANGSARVCVNGMLSDAFPVLNGLPQGSTASPPLWVIQMQPLTSFLRRQVEQGALRTPLLPSGEQAPPAAHHADDTTLTARDPAVDGPVLMAAVQLFCRASNARVHPDKSKAMGLGRFVAIWTAGGALCEVEEVQGGSPKLNLRLTLASPVQAP
ncbi:hypothetical protein CHLRE_06g278290v5 [Chlamydomonas reinhardtii]|uniref:Reverse transcriptase domain-containing protein n=1 Tax=Chlamydomonas reinhardtii TaxID=3055 RepID=A0A2K3DPG0_CHLRE|nr:uncharacterized protein CHLRE_06g278290v5 [Chlamydomonas reinhardtii]PNW82407.1 hypothetical protein CHLRE_06g278290v5 [Chlamydomonas reinhardtii]